MDSLPQPIHLANETVNIITQHSNINVTTNILNKVDWKFKNNLINFCIRNGAKIFGGAVRDKYIHDLHSTKFYELKHPVSPVITIDFLYNDRSYHPELYGRWVIPNDIDVSIKEENYTTFINSIERNYKYGFGLVQKIFERDPVGYISDLDIEEGKLKHIRYIISPIDTSRLKDTIRLLKILDKDVINESNIDKMLLIKPVQLDILVVMNTLSNSNIEAPFGKIDFECNALILDNYGFRLSLEYQKVINTIPPNPIYILQKFNNILADIEKKETNAVNIKWYRYDKIKNKGWKIKNTFINFEIKDTEYDGHCIVCHDKMSENDMIKMMCCDARYHFKCLYSACIMGSVCIANTNKCCMCSFQLKEVETDINSLQDYNNYYS